MNYLTWNFHSFMTFRFNFTSSMEPYNDVYILSSVFQALSFCFFFSFFSLAKSPICGSLRLFFECYIWQSCKKVISNHFARRKLYILLNDMTYIYLLMSISFIYTYNFCQVILPCILPFFFRFLKKWFWKISSRDTLI